MNKQIYEILSRALLVMLVLGCAGLIIGNMEGDAFKEEFGAYVAWISGSIYAVLPFSLKEDKDA